MCGILVPVSTFHSVYISTVSSDSACMYVFNSTFHSVYISTNVLYKDSKDVMSLHSTLFILVLDTQMIGSIPRGNSTFHSVYIST